MSTTSISTMSTSIPTMSTLTTTSISSNSELGTWSNLAAFLEATGKPSPPPPGVTANFNAPNPNGMAMIVVSIVGMILCTTITAMRMWTKGYLMRTVGWDDYTCLFSLAGIIIWTVTNVKIYQLGYGLPDYEIRHSNAAQMLVGKYQFISQGVYLFTIACVKVSILLMYLRAFTGSKKFKYTVWVLIFLISAAHTVAFVGWNASIIPASCHWTYYPNDWEYDARCYHPVIDRIQVSYTLFLNAFTVVMDLVILYLPCKPVWRLNLAKRQKISILVILFAGFIVTIASTLRLGYFVRRFYQGKVDVSLTNFRVNLITTFELDLAQLCACLPILKPFMRQYAPGLLQLGTFSSRSKDRSSNHPVASSQHPIKAGRKWPRGSRDEELIHSNYLELGEDGKSDQSYAMSSVAIKEGK